MSLGQLEKEAFIGVIGKGLKTLGKQVAKTSRANGKKGLGMIDSAKNQAKTVAGVSKSFAKKNPMHAAGVAGGTGLAAGYALGSSGKE